MEAAYAAAGWRYRLVQAGVSDEDGEMEFYHVGRGDKALERGFSAQVEKCKKKKKIDCPGEVAKVVRLSGWIDREVHGRIIPAAKPTEGRRTRQTSTEEEEEEEGEEGTSNISTLPPKVVMKMDIEFYEFLVLPDLLTSGVLCRDVDALMVEFHTSKRASGDYPISFPNRSGEEGGGSGGPWTLATNEDAGRLRDEMIGMVRRNPNCRTEIVVRDDETHESDGMPWPAAAAAAAAAAEGGGGGGGRHAASPT